MNVRDANAHAQSRIECTAAHSPKARRGAEWSGVC